MYMQYYQTFMASGYFRVTAQRVALISTVMEDYVKSALLKVNECYA